MEEQKEHDREEEKKYDPARILVPLVMFLLFSGYIAFEWFFGGSMPDCSYSNLGCQGDDSRFGQ